MTCVAVNDTQLRLGIFSGVISVLEVGFRIVTTVARCAILAILRLVSVIVLVIVV